MRESRTYGSAFAAREKRADLKRLCRAPRPSSQARRSTAQKARLLGSLALPRWRRPFALAANFYHGPGLRAPSVHRMIE
jgi:hypothetical protein